MAKVRLRGEVRLNSKAGGKNTAGNTLWRDLEGEGGSGKERGRVRKSLKGGQEDRMEEVREEREERKTERMKTGRKGRQNGGRQGMGGEEDGTGGRREEREERKIGQRGRATTRINSTTTPLKKKKAKL